MVVSKKGPKGVVFQPKEKAMTEVRRFLPSLPFSRFPPLFLSLSLSLFCLLLLLLVLLLAVLFLLLLLMLLLARKGITASRLPGPAAAETRRWVRCCGCVLAAINRAGWPRPAGRVVMWCRGPLWLDGNDFCSTTILLFPSLYLPLFFSLLVSFLSAHPPPRLASPRLHSPHRTRRTTS